MNILFINGVNTSYGGSGKNSLRNWLESFPSFFCNIQLLNTVPDFGFKKRGRMANILLFIYFSPGSFLRYLGNPISELFYKASPFLLYKILCYKCNKYNFVVFTHYCVFIYFFLIKKEKRIFIVQDLLYIRAKSLGYLRRSH
jgi:hypothetical protein